MSLMTQVGMEFIARDKSRAGINSFRGNLNRTSRTVKSLGHSLLAVAGVGGGMYMLGNVMRSGVREAAAFEKQMANVSTMLSDQSMHLLPRYTERLRVMSKEFGEGTETLSKGLYDILSASVAPARALDVLAVSTRAAKAGLTDTGIAADAITTILNSYSLEADRAADVSDKLFGIVIKGKTTFGELAPNIGKVAALAATAGESFDDLGAVMATMTRAGVQTEIAITSLRAIILSFLKPQSDSIEMARRYGVELNSNTLRTIGLTGVITKLKKATAEELAVIVPTSRAITGFAAAIQKSEGLASDYNFMLNSLGSTEKAYQKIADTSAFKLDQLNQEWIDMKRVVGELTIGPLTGFLEDVTWGIDRLATNLKNASKGFKELLQDYNNLMYQSGKAPPGKTQSYGMWAPMPQINEARKAPGNDSGFGQLGEAFQRAQILTWMQSLQMNGPSAFKGSEIKAPARTAGVDEAAIVERTNAQIVADTREKLASIRALDTMTRMEKIQNLKDYQAAHGYTMAGVTEQERLLAAEIASIQSSRQDAMKVYRAELREDMQNTALYTSEKYAEAAQSIESSMSGAFESMIADGASWKDAMSQFFTDVSRAFARMAADMAARAMMDAWIAPLMSGLAGGIGGLFSQTASVGAGATYASGSPTMPDYASTLHAGWVPEDVPSFHGGRGMKSDERVALIKDDELLAPADKVIRSPFSRGGSAAPNINIYNESGQQIEQKGEPEFDGEKWVIGLVAKNITQGGSLSKLMAK